MQDWRVLYEATLHEADPNVLKGLIVDTEEALCTRLRQLPKRTNEQSERNEVREAAVTLMRLRKMLGGL